MTDEEHDALMQVKMGLEEVRELAEQASQAATRTEEFLFNPLGPNRPTRAYEIDQALESLRTGKRGARFFLWLCGGVVAVIAAYNAVRGLK